MGDGGSRGGGGGGGGGSSKAGVYVLGPVEKSLMGGRNSTTMESFESSGLGFVWGIRMKVDVHKTGVMSRRSGLTPRRSRGFNVETFQKGYTKTSRH